jgi:predicted acylesterase/phospholipase RssA
MATSEKPAQSCDIVMKGGITSGVVYPLALVALAEKFRFSNIGGTSAGAIAAAAAAAAEYGRPIKDAGFDRVARIPQEIGPSLLSLFQPTPVLKPLFDIFVAALKAKTGLGQFAAIIKAAICGYWLSALLGVLPGAIVAAIAVVHRNGGGVAFGLLLALLGLIVGLIWRLAKAAKIDLVANDFGLCPGIRQSASAPEAFTDWLARLIQEAAGRQKGDSPLTFGDLLAPPDNAPPINLQMMTTSLMEERPYTLPMDNKRFFFRRDEWEKIFPSEISAFLVGKCDRFPTPPEEAGEFYYFPDPARLPLIVGARMSLSFPGLISAVPLWTRDFTLIEEDERNKLRRCLFSDGGLSSNFPIHFFDHLLPNSPTFAISLDDFDEKRNRNNVWLPSTAASGSQLPILPFNGLGGFLMRLVYSAKDWQDNLQSTLPGYRERIVHVVLKPDQGDLNLTMSQATIEQLVKYGEDAGTMLRDDFDLDEHRWRRFLVSMARMEETLDEVAAAYAQVPGQFGDFLDDYVRDQAPYYQPPSGKAHPPYSQDTKARVDEMLKRAAELVDLGTTWKAQPTIRGGKIPKPATHLRITPKY